MNLLFDTENENKILKEYLSPEFEIVKLTFKDVVCASDEGGLFPSEGHGGGDDWDDFDGFGAFYMSDD